MILYKYLPAARIDVLEKALIRFSPPWVFNDPFECLPQWVRRGPTPRSPWTRYVKRMLAANPRNLEAEVKQQSHLGYLRTHFSDLGILALSRDPKNILMWGHYTECHRGFVIGFEVADGRFIKQCKRIEPVRYTDARSVLSRDWQLRAPFRKSRAWAYEKEWRAIAPMSEADEVVGPLWGSLKLFSFSRTCVSSVIVGYAAPQKFQTTLGELIRETYKGAQLYRSVLDRRRFRMQLIKIPRWEGLALRRPVGT